MARQKVLITGVYGLVAGAVYTRLAKQPDHFEVFGLSRRRKASDRVSSSETVEVPESHFILSDLSDQSQLEEVVKGMDAIVHMAAEPNGDAEWESVLQNNIVASHNVFEAARVSGVKRIVYASTIQVSAGFTREEEVYRNIAYREFDKVPEDYPMVTTDMTSRPMNLYAASKLFCEAMGSVYSRTHGMSCIGLRIGWVKSNDAVSEAGHHVYCSRNDVAKLTECCLRADKSVKCEVFYAMSRNRYLWTDISNAERIVGYVPDDDDSHLHD